MMKKLHRVCLFFLLGLQVVAAQSISAVNAASFNASDTLSPNMIISVFGANLTNVTASATDANHLPAFLGGVTLTINGTAALLFYVSPTQVNAMVGPTTAPGHSNLVLTSPTANLTTTVNVNAAAPPGIFSLQSSGTHDGAVLNAVTFKGGAFSVNTNGGPTFLAIFVTGLDLKTPPIVTIGGVQVAVQFFGAAPGFQGLEQINVQLPSSLAGSGRVEVTISQGGMKSNVVEVVILPNPGQGSFPNDQPNQERSRELAAMAWVPTTSLVLVTDENDDVVRVVDVQQRKVTQVIALTEGSEPSAIAVNATGTIAVVAERSRNMVAIIDLATFMIKSEVKTGRSPVSVAISGNIAVVVNQDSDSVSFIDISAGTQAAADVFVGGRAPRAVAIDPTTNRAYVTVQDAGIVVPINLATHTALTPISLGSTSRPANIQVISSLGLLVITEPSAGPDGKVIIVNIATGTSLSINVNPDKSGGSSDLVVAGTKAFFANQSGGSVTLLPVSVLGTGTIVAPPTAIKVDLGARALAVDTKDNLLLVTNEGSGTIVLVDLNTNTVVGRIDAVRAGEGDDMDDDHSDRDHAANMPSVTSIAPPSAKAGTTFTITIKGANLANASAVLFLDPSTLPGDGHGNPGRGHGPFGSTDPGIAVTNIVSTATQVTAQIAIASGHAPGTRVVRVSTPNGTSSLVASSADTFTIQ